MIQSIFGDLRAHAKSLVLTDIAYKVLALIVLLPLVGLLFRILVALSGNSMLADMDLAMFFLGPVGWVCFLVIGALWLAIVALEQAALLGILAAGRGGKHVGVLGALRFAASSASAVVRVTARMLGVALVVLLPAAGLIGLIYVMLLGEHDINFYLSERPPVFLVALSLAGVVLATAVGILLRLATGWFFALPLVLFEETPAAEALAASRGRATGHRRVVLAWIVGWFVAGAVVSGIASSLAVFLGQTIVPRFAENLTLMAGAVGFALLVWAVANLAVNLLSTIVFACMLFEIYMALAAREEPRLSRLDLKDANPELGRLVLTRGRLLALAVIGVLLAMGVGAVAVETVAVEDRTQITAHRGSSAAAPENTLAAIRLAIEEGADWVEIDVQETADDEVVVFHDADFMRVADHGLKIWDATREDLAGLDIGSKFSPDFSDQRAPTLAEVLALCRGKVGVNIELKYYGYDRRLEQRVAEIVESQGMADRVVVMSLKRSGVEKMKALRPDWKVGLLLSVSAGDLRDVDVDFLAVNADFASRSFVRSAHAMGREVHAWTVNDARTMSVLIGRGVDYLITDKPALARSVLRQRAEMNVAERLLLELTGLFGVAPQIEEL